MYNSTIRRLVTAADIEHVMTRSPIVGITKACQEINRSLTHMLDTLHRRGLKAQRPPIKCRVDPKQFQNIDDPRVAYVLGLLWADGHVRTAKSTH